MKKLLLITFFLGNTIAIFAQKEMTAEERYEWRLKQEKLYGIYIPKDLTDAFVELNKKINTDSKMKFKNAPEEVVAKKLHFSLGRWMMVNWGFYEGSRLTAFLNKLDLHHPDDMARFIIITFHRSVNRTPLEVKDLVEELKTKRANLEQDRLLQGEILHQETRIREQPDSTENRGS
ncbi:MAG: DUF6794 domain-containing protein [Bacteroidota bacterium]